jgi:CNT family concentrative nucleoside transporter
MERLVGVLGIFVILGVAYAMSNNRKAISWKPVLVGLGIQLVLALLILKVPGTRDAFMLIGHGVEKLLDYAVEGAAFVVGDELAKGKFIFLIRVGASIVFVAALSSMAYYLGIMQGIVKLGARLLTKTMGISGPEAVSATSAVLVGQVECQVLIKPFMAKLTQSELFCSMTAAMATISGSALVSYTALGMNPTYLIAASIMSVVAGIVVGKIVIPETNKAVLSGKVELADCKEGANVFDAIAIGAMDGFKIAVNVMIMVMVAVGMVAMINGGLGWVLGHFGVSWTIQDIFGVFLTPVAFLMGVPWDSTFEVGRLMATEIFVNEFAAYGELSTVIAGKAAYSFDARTQLIATIALCGFANLGSIAINIGGLGAMAPERRGEIARLALRALICANLATWMTAAIAGVLF